MDKVVREDGERNILGRVTSEEECTEAEINPVWPNNSVLMTHSEDGYASIVPNFNKFRYILFTHLGFSTVNGSHRILLLPL